MESDAYEHKHRWAQKDMGHHTIPYSHTFTTNNDLIAHVLHHHRLKQAKSAEFVPMIFPVRYFQVPWFWPFFPHSLIFPGLENALTIFQVFHGFPLIVGTLEVVKTIHHKRDVDIFTMYLRNKNSNISLHRRISKKKQTGASRRMRQKMRSRWNMWKHWKLRTESWELN